MTFASPKDLDRWLKVNHVTESELWVKIFKIKTEIPSVTWEDVVIETLRWGWIMVSRSQSMTKPISSGSLQEKREATGQKGTEIM